MKVFFKFQEFINLFRQQFVKCYLIYLDILSVILEMFNLSYPLTVDNVFINIINFIFSNVFLRKLFIFFNGFIMNHHADIPGIKLLELK